MNGNGQQGLTQRDDLKDRAAASPDPFEVQGPSIAEILWHRRWIIVGTLAVCLAVGCIYLYQATPIYTSTSRLYVERKGPRVVFETEGVMMESKNYLSTQCELIKSTPILASALEQPGIKQLKTFAGLDNPLGYVKKSLHVDAGTDEIINVSVESQYPQEAAQLTNFIVEAYIDNHKLKKKDTAFKVMQLLKKQKSESDAELSEKRQKMLAFRQINGAVSNEHGTSRVKLERLADLSKALTEAQLAAIAAKSVYESARSAVDDPAKLMMIAEVQNEKEVFGFAPIEHSRLQNELNKLRLQAAVLRSRFLDQAPLVKSLNAQMHELRQLGEESQFQIAESYAKRAKMYVAVMRQRWLNAQQLERDTQSFFQVQQRQVETLSEKTSEYAILKSDLDRTERFSDMIHTRIKELDVSEDTGALNIHILEVARAAALPFKPQRVRIMAITLVAGLFVGGSLAYLRDRLDQRLQSVDDISVTLGLPVLGVVPHFSDNGDGGRLVHHDSRSNTSEAYRTIRTAVYFGVPKDQARTLLITSPTPGDGKTTLVSNLAIAMAQAGQRTLILDADFRKPRQHNIFDLTGNVGLTNVLTGRKDLDDVIQKTEIKGLDMIPCGSLPPNPSEMLNSQTFADVLAKLGETYDHIVVDSPPIMPVTDARILSAMCDVTILVLRAERSTRKTSMQSCESILSVGGRILGTVVNAVQHRRGPYGYYSSYGYQSYGYGYGGESQKQQKKADRKDRTEKVEV